jgi:hypothetical protein
LTRVFFSAVVALLFCFRLFAAEHPAYNSVAVDVPFDGGAMLTYSRYWRLNHFIDAGWIISGGQIDRNFDLKDPSGAVYKTKTKAWVAPMTGPVVTLHANWIGISIGYAAFYADTDITMKNDVVGTLTGNKKAWGSGIYSPLLVLDFYDQRHDLIFGFGLGGYFGTSYPALEASAPGIKIATNESPIDTLTVHARVLWGDGRSKRNEDSGGL